MCQTYIKRFWKIQEIVYLKSQSVKSWRELHFLFTNISQELEDSCRAGGSAQIPQHSVWRGDLEHTSRYQSSIKCIQNNKTLSGKFRLQRAQFSNRKNGPRKPLLTNWEYEVPGEDGTVALIKIDWGVSLLNCKTFLFIVLNFKHESIYRGEWEIWLPYPLSRQKNQPLDGEGIT